MTQKTQAIIAVLAIGSTITKKLVAEVAQISEARAVKKAVVNLDEVRKVDKAGKATKIKCSASGVWLPATVDFFYEDKKGNKDFGNLLRRSRQAEKIYKDFNKAVKEGKEKIWADFNEDKIDGGQAKALMKKLPVAPDYSQVTDTVKVAPTENSVQAVANTEAKK